MENRARQKRFQLSNYFRISDDHIFLHAHYGLVVKILFKLAQRLPRYILKFDRDAIVTI